MKRIIVICILLFAIVLYLFLTLNNHYQKTLVSKHPMYGDSVFTLRISYLNGYEGCYSVMLPSDSYFYLDNKDGIYVIKYKYNHYVDNNGYCDKVLKLGVSDFEIINTNKIK